MRKNWGLLSLLFLPSLVWGAPGKTGFGFLNLGSGARATAMGDAYSASAEGANAVYWNPAGLGLTPSNELALTYLKQFEDSSQQYASLALPIKKGEWGGLGFSITKFSVGEIEARDATSERIGTVEQNDLNLQLSYGFRVGGKTNSSDRDGLYLGAGVKRVSEELAGISASAVAWDTGLQYRPGTDMSEAFGEWTRRTTLALSVLNAGGGAKFDTEETPLPQTVRLGTAYTQFLWGDALNLEVDGHFPRGDKAKFSGGAEFWLKNAFALRLGWAGPQETGSGLRAGAGLRFQSIQFDYAWAGFGDQLGDTHRFSVNFRFGNGVVTEQTGLKKDLVSFHLSQAQDNLASGLYHEAVIEANRVLEVDPRNPQALQILIEAGEKMKPTDSLPAPKAEPSPEPENKPEESKP